MPEGSPKCQACDYGFIEVEDYFGRTSWVRCSVCGGLGFIEELEDEATGEQRGSFQVQIESR